MKKIILLCLLAMSTTLMAQKSKSKAPAEIKVNMTATNWEFTPGTVEFINQNGTPAMKILNATERVKLKDVRFSDGTIEFDVEEAMEPFAGIFFRMADNRETEYFYLRVARAGNPVAMDAAQYAAFHKGVNLWDMLPHFQGPAKISKTQRNHVKLVISGKQMIVYVNDTIPTLEIPYLEGNFNEGGIAFNGRCILTNLVIKPGAVEGLPARAGFDPTHHDPRYIRTWQATEPQTMPKGKELSDDDFPKANTAWKVINAERRGLVNLTRLHGVDGRRLVWLRTTLTSSSEQKRKINFGFSDEVWVFVNRQPVYFDKNFYGSPAMQKEPDGRISVENTEFTLPLRKGDNEVLIGVANDFFGWGIVARIDNMEGIEVHGDKLPPTIASAEIDKFAGTYSGKEIAIRITIKRDGDQLTAQPGTSQPIAFDYIGNNRFYYVKDDVTLEFVPAENKMILTERGGTVSLTRE